MWMSIILFFFSWKSCLSFWLLGSDITYLPSLFIQIIICWFSTDIHTHTHRSYHNSQNVKWQYFKTLHILSLTSSIHNCILVGFVFVINKLPLAEWRLPLLDKARAKIKNKRKKNYHQYNYGTKNPTRKCDTWCY